MKRLPVLCYIAGIALVLLSLGLLAGSLLHAQYAKKQNAAVIAQLRGRMPEKTVGVAGNYSNPEMPVLQLDGTDYVCLLEVPGLDVALPVGNRWETNALQNHPCRFWGSIYDGSCILGGSGQSGQFDFCAQLDIGDIILLTDMGGAVFSCSVQKIERAKSADFERLLDADYPLTLFVRQEYSSAYIIVRCGWRT